MTKRKKDINATGLSLALTFGIISLICLILVFISPSFALTLFGSFMHGIDMTKIAIIPVFSWITVRGFAVALIGGYAIGIIFAAIYNKFAKD